MRQDTQTLVGFTVAGGPRSVSSDFIDKLLERSITDVWFASVAHSMTEILRFPSVCSLIVTRCVFSSPR